MRPALAAMALFATMVSGEVLAAPLTEAEATYLEQLVTASAVLEQRCTGYEVDGAGGVQLGARLLGGPEAAMAMIGAYDAAIKAHDGSAYDVSKFRPEVFEAAGRTFKRVRTELIRSPDGACADYGDSSVSLGLLRRH
jgi:hypothetical protein